ncbi:hypothetical protein SAMN05892883_4314 [Jatrophihabitans sp. GAS493]|uniref:DivIVA domain-containing protein n=1 Tax=Jatrophihabitans sp. GAS493 TaxID=1907575 RepID=UPI000BB87B14|nr:DivIVA domain-containing protein [Jatrophihabitans sp. GAS493]SOD75109.1 hypothetical protein SAMN05892883_4314 [Jatrophihabitans sp. GAS493]
MLSLLLYGLLAVVAVGILFLIAVYLLPAGTRIAPVATDEALPQQLPDSLLSASDVATVRLPVALRGYRFAETDRLLDRLSNELLARDQELAWLRGQLSGQLSGAPTAVSEAALSQTVPSEPASATPDPAPPADE